MELNLKNSFKIDDNKKELLISEFRKNSKINEEISIRKKEIDTMNTKIKLLQEKLLQKQEELSVLQEIKNSQKIFLSIDEKINSHIDKLKKQNALNTWKEIHSSDSDSFSVKMLSIKNATYTANIIINNNKSRNFFRIDSELSVSSVLLNLAKQYKRKYENIEDVRIIKEGLVVHTYEDVEFYVNQIKEKYKIYFEKEKSPMLNKFKDISENEYTASDFIMYDNMYIDNYEIIENNIVKSNDNEIPF